MASLGHIELTHWGRVTHICVNNLTIIGSDNGLSPQRRQAIIWTNAGILLIGPLGTNISEILFVIQTFSLKKIRLKMSSAKCCSFRLGLNVLNHCPLAQQSHIQQMTFPYLFLSPALSEGKGVTMELSSSVHSFIWSFICPSVHPDKTLQTR